MSHLKETQNFEKGRIKALQDERVYIQKKTFTKWANSFLEKARLEIRDLFKDLADGKILMKLLELISGENLGRPNKGVLRVQKVENVNRSLQFLATKVYFENIGAEDIVDGNPRLILGLIWTIILRFQIQEITIVVNEEAETGEKKSAKDALLLWCQRKTAGYPGVKIDNFRGSWRNGLAFNALIHAHRPDLIDYDALIPSENIRNLNNAFDVADQRLGLSKILDAEDVDVARPDDRVIMTYVATYFHYFAKLKTEKTGGKRIAKIMGTAMDVHNMEDNYEGLTSDLLSWIQDKVVELDDHRFPNSLEDIQRELIRFKQYRTVEKPPKYQEKGNIEVQYFNIQAKLKANGQKFYTPPDGRLIHDIERAWSFLEKSEHEREVALRDELIRQERLEQLAQRFSRKGAIRESWLSDMNQILEEKIVCNNASQAEAAIKKHEAISAEIMARKDRFLVLNSLAEELVHGDYHSKDEIKAKDQEIMVKWRDLVALLEKRKVILSGYNHVMGIVREIESIRDELSEVEGKVASGDTGRSLRLVEDNLQKHSHIEPLIKDLSKRVSNINRRSHKYADLGQEAEFLDTRLDDLNKYLDQVKQLSNKRKDDLELARKYFQFLQDAEEEEKWATERMELCQSAVVGKDLHAANMLLKKHEALEYEIQGHSPRSEEICTNGEDLVRKRHANLKEIKQRVQSLRDKWDQLRRLATIRKTRLEDAIEAQQYYADANEAESWIKERMPLVCSDDYGRDEASAQALLTRHNRIDKDIKAFNIEICRLSDLAALMTKAATEHNISPQQFQPVENGTKSEDEEDERMMNVPHEIEVEELVEREVMQDMVEIRKVPQVKGLYSYKGQGMKVDKGEIMLLLQKTNSDWWQVRKLDGVEGFVPANYVKETEPRVSQRVVKRPVMVPEKVKVKRTIMKKELVKVKKESSPSLRRAPSVRNKGNLHFDKDNVETRQKAINVAYVKVHKLSKSRKSYLEDAIKLFHFYRESDEFEAWMIDKEDSLQSRESLADNMETVKKKFDDLLTSLAANKGRLDEIIKLADEIVKAGSSQKDEVLKRKKDINDRWDNLNRMKQVKEKSLEGYSSVELFKSTCDELQDWINEKKNELGGREIGKDKNSIDALRRKHANLERELVPVDEKMQRMKYLADSVKSSYPDESGYVDQRQKDIEGYWQGLQDKSRERKRSLDDSKDREQFKEESKDLLSWANKVKSGLAKGEMPRDVQSAEKLCKEHDELRDEIDRQKEKFQNLRALGQQVLNTAPDSQAADVEDKLKRLQEAEDAIEDLWLKRQKQLKDAYDLQAFNREADQIDSATSSHEAFLEFGDLGTTVDSVEKLLKRHEDFQNTLQAQDEKVNALSELADKLQHEKHPDTERINKRRDQVVDRRQGVRDKAADRHNALLSSQAYQEFRRDAHEISEWVKEKHKTATDESYRDPTNLQAKLLKHQAFEAELKANNEQLKGLNQLGNDLIKDKHFASPEVKRILNDLNHQWQDLSEKSAEKGRKLREAQQQHMLERALDDAQAKLDEMEKSVQSEDVGADLRGVKQLLNKHQMLETDLSMLSENIQSIVSQSQALAEAGHFNSDTILRKVNKFTHRFENLKPAVAARKQKLQDSLKWHQYNFDADSELQWIKEHLPAATSTDYGKSLIDAQNLTKKHQKLEKEVHGHQPVIDKVLSKGEKMIEAHHFASKPIKDRLQQVQVSWDDLLNKCKIRKKNLDLSLQTQKYLSEVAEVESWVNEKITIVTSSDYGKDEDAADKAIAKNKVLETDIQTYQNIVNGLGKESTRLIKCGHNDPSNIKRTQDMLQEKLTKLKRLAADRRGNLDESKGLHMYDRESNDLEDWIEEQLQTAMSEEYGRDYEHLLILRNKYDDFKRNVETGSDRFNRCEQLAATQIEAKSPNSEQIAERQDHLRDSWNNLLEQIEARDQRLLGAGEIHRFNRDVEDALTRIQEKEDSIPDDLGRDINSTQGYLKRHDVFENELVALEAQLQVLIDDSARLQKAYPGENAAEIENLQATVIERWGFLEDHSSRRKEELLAALDLHQFLSSVRELLSWSDEIEREMMADIQVRDVQSVILLQAAHDQLKLEIEARDSTFNTVVATGRALIVNEHGAKEEILEKVDQVLAAQDRLRDVWADRRNYHDKLHNLHAFLRDANQLDTISTSQEAFLGSTDVGTTVDQAERLIRKHEAFEKVLGAQEDKLDGLKETGSNLVKEKHFAAEKIQTTMNEVVIRREKVKDQCCERRKNLEDSLLYAQFNRNVVEAEGWIDDKLKVAYEDNFQDATDLQGKMRKLQKHQAFEAEIVANTDRINKIEDQGEEMIKNCHGASREITQCVQRLSKKWKELLQASANRGKGLEEAKDILEFNEQVDKVETWMREKEMLVNAGDLGRDYEHCLELQKKVNNLESAGITVDESRIKFINDLADKLITQGRSDTRAVKQRRSDMNTKWKELQGALNNYKSQLTGALEIHAFNRDVDDIDDRINEKSLLLSVEDLGKDLAGVQALQRKQEQVERDMTALQSQLEKMETLANKLCRKHPSRASAIQTKQQEAADNWEKLEDLADARKVKLLASYQLQKFLTDAKELMTWSSDMTNRMNSGELAKDVVEAENLLQMHHERKAEIEGRKSHFSTVREHGLNLINDNHYARNEILKIIKQLDTTKLTLNGAWDKRNNVLTQCHDLQMFNETAEQADSWLATKEAFLSNEDLGATLYTVEALLKNHDGFEKTLRAQNDRIEDLQQFAVDLCEKKHYASDDIKSRCQMVLDRRTKLWESSAARRKKLEDSKLYQLFQRNLYEVRGWINEKLQVAMDESYRDPTNLQAKIQKHQAFEAEMTANRNRVDAVVQEGQGLIDEDHYSKTEITNNLEELEKSWETLMDASHDKKDKLQEAYQALLFNRLVDDLNTWFDDVENQLMSEDHGKDLVSVNILLKKHQLLEQDIANHHEKVQDVVSSSRDFRDNKHFLSKELQSRSKEISERYGSLTEPCIIRRENLNDALVMYKLYRDIADELSWIEEKMPTAASDDLGSSLTAVQNLMKKHVALEGEMVSHEPLIDYVASEAQHLITTKHFAAQDIQKQLDLLHNNLLRLKELASGRKIRLQNSLEVQKFYSEVFEAESWMKERIPLLTSSDMGKDEDSVLALLKKLESLDRDIDNFSNNIGELAALSHNLVDRNHYDSENIKTQQSNLEKRYSELQDLTSKRRMRLNDMLKMFEFYREADEVESWISEKGAIASSEEYGQDLEHVQVLQEKFEDFIYELTSSETRVVAVTAMADTMKATGHFEFEAIVTRATEVNQMWIEVNEVQQTRKEALISAKQVHLYGREVDDTLDWIQEKDGVVTSDDYGHDLETVQSLISRHEGLERDLAAISEQVENITKEAERLISLFPDAQEHVATKHEEMVQAWNNLVEKASLRKEKLQQADQLQMYFNDYRELTAWISEIMAVITGDDLARDITGAEAMLSRNREHKAEIDSHQEAVTRFRHTGQTLIDNGHFLSEEIQEKIHHLNKSLDTLLVTWEQRRILYEQNLEAQQFKHEMDQLDAWMSFREPVVRQQNCGDSIQVVEELLRRHADFEKTVDAQDSKFDAIRRHTQIEQAFIEQKVLEQQQIANEEAQREKDRIEELRRREQERILEERRREEEQRKAREVLLQRHEGSSSDDEDQSKGEGTEKHLGKSIVKNLIGRNQSMKIEAGKEVKRAMSFHNKGEPTSPTVTLQKPVEFHQDDGKASESGDKAGFSAEVEVGVELNMVAPVVSLNLELKGETTERSDSPRSVTSHDDPEPPLPNLPPPSAPKSPGYSKKETIAPPLSPGQGRHNTPSKDDKKSKRTPSFNIRRKTRSFKDKYRLPSGLPPAEKEGSLERKQELQSGGKKATIRHWKTYHTVLFGQLLCFFKDKEAYLESSAAAPPLHLHQALCEIAKDYTKKKNVLRLRLHDGAEFLLEAPNQAEMNDWLIKIKFYAATEPTMPPLEFNFSGDTDEWENGGLDPSQQFRSFDRSQSPASLHDEAADSSKDDDDVVIPGISVHMGQQLETEVSITRKDSDKKSLRSDDGQVHVASNQSIVLEADQERRNGNVVLDSSSPSSTLSADSEPATHKRQESESQLSIPSSQSDFQDEDDVPSPPASILPAPTSQHDAEDDEHEGEEKEYEVKVRPKPTPRRNDGRASLAAGSESPRPDASRRTSEPVTSEKKKGVRSFFKRKKGDRDHKEHKEHKK